MAVSNFIQSIWSKKIQDDLELKTKLVQNVRETMRGTQICGLGKNPRRGRADNRKV